MSEKLGFLFIIKYLCAKQAKVFGLEKKNIFLCNVLEISVRQCWYWLLFDLEFVLIFCKRTQALVSLIFLLDRQLGIWSLTVRWTISQHRSGKHRLLLDTEIKADSPTDSIWERRQEFITALNGTPTSPELALWLTCVVDRDEGRCNDGLHLLYSFSLFASTCFCKNV